MHALLLLAAGLAFAGPAIESVEPPAVRAGGGSFILKLRGRGFLEGAILRLNGAERPTAVIGPNALTAMIEGRDVAETGKLELRVEIAGPKGVELSPPAILRVESADSGAAAPRDAGPNPEPALERVSPPIVEAGGMGVTLKVFGSGFTPDSAVRWNGARRKTRFIAPDKLEAVIPARDLAQPGGAWVSVRTPLPGGGVSRPVRVTVRPEDMRALDKPRVFPNPWRADSHMGMPVVFDRLSKRSRVKIFTSTGDWVATIAARDRAVLWDLTGASGASVPPGAYVFWISDGRKQIGGKLTIVR